MQQSQELQTAKAAPLVCCTEGSFKQNCAQTGNNGSAASFPLLLKHTFRVVSHPPRSPPPHRRRRRLILFSFGCSHLFIWRRCAEFPLGMLSLFFPFLLAHLLLVVVVVLSLPLAARSFSPLKLRFVSLFGGFFSPPFFCRLLIAACALKAVGGC